MFKSFEFGNKFTKINLRYFSCVAGDENAYLTFGGHIRSVKGSIFS